MNIVFLMGGKNTGNKDDYPLYLTELHEKLILEKQVEYAKLMYPDKFVFCAKNADIKKYRLDSIIAQLTENHDIVGIHGNTKGAVCTALLAFDTINTKKEVVFMAIDDFIDVRGTLILNYFRKNVFDAGVVSFNSVHPRYSFVKIDLCGEIVEFAEKLPISKDALVSFYYFRRGVDFVSCAMDVIRKDSPVNGSFYISQILNEMILRQKKIGIYKVENKNFHPLKTEIQLAHYLSELKEIKESK